MPEIHVDRYCLDRTPKNKTNFKKQNIGNVSGIDTIEIWQTIEHNNSFFLIFC